MASHLVLRKNFKKLHIVVAAFVLASATQVAPFGEDRAYAASCGAGASSYGGGDGTSGSPYVISDASHLIRLSANSSDWNKNFLQSDDVDLGDCDWSPIGTMTSAPSTGSAFSGVYDGGGYSISGLNVGSQPGVAAGLFGWVAGPSVAIRNLKLFGQVSSNDEYVGGLVGYADGDSSSDRVEISRVHSAIEITYSAGNYAGGLVGQGNDVRISYSKFTGDIITSASFANAAGFSGYSTRVAVVDSYSISDFSGASTYKAGVFGWGGGGTAERVFSVPSGADAGFTNGADTATNFFWDTTVGPAAAKRGGGSVSGATGLSTTDLTTFSTFDDASWGIVDGWEAFDSSASKIWGICSSVNDGYPFLLWEYSSNPCAIQSTASQGSSASIDTGNPGIFLTVQGKNGERTSEVEILFGAFSIAPSAPYLLSISSDLQGAPVRILARGNANRSGHLEEEAALGMLPSGEHRIILRSQGQNGALLVLTNVVQVDSLGNLTYITPESRQPFAM